MLKPFMIACVILAALVLGSTFLPWYTIVGRAGAFTGLEEAFAGRVNIGLSVVAIVFFLVNKDWMATANLVVTGLLLTMTILNFRNYNGCAASVCLHRQAGLYTSLIGASLCFVVLVFDRLVVKVFFPPIPPGAWYNGSSK